MNKIGWIAALGVTACASVDDGAGDAARGARQAAVFEHVGGKLLLELPVVPQASGGPTVGDVKTAYDRTSKAYQILGDYRRCQEAGGTNCGWEKVVWPGACFVASEVITAAMAPAWGDLGLPIESICLGEPALKCCQSNTPVIGCHSAFNSDAPINCEGNPYYPNPTTAGPCLSTGAGCRCDYLAQCATGALYDPPAARAWRLDAFAQALGRSLLDAQGGDAQGGLARADAAGFMDYVTLTGCRSHRAHLLHDAPFAGDDALPASLPAGSAYHANDDDATARYLRALVSVAVRRVLAGVPNLQGRWHVASARAWSAAEIAAHVAPVGDPDALLRGLLGPFGLAMVKRAEPVRYALLAVPTADEAPGANAVPWVGACVPGAAPTLSLSATTVDGAPAVRAQITDPEAANDPSGVYPLFVDWGDGQTDTMAYVAGDASTHVLRHTWRGVSGATVRAYAENSAGLGAAAALTLAVPSLPGPPPTLAVRSVTPRLTATVNAGSFGTVWVDVEGQDVRGAWHRLGRSFVRMSGAPATTASAPLAEARENTSLTPLVALRLRPGTAGFSVVQRPALRLSSVAVTDVRGVTREVAPGIADVQVLADGAAVPTSPSVDPATRELVLPWAGAAITVRLSPAGVSPLARGGCRVAYGVGAPLMRTAQGGCEDVATGLVWSLLSPAPMSWHDAVWDSAQPSNAPPDANDYGRTADYAATPAVGRDSSRTNYCHELVEGGFADWRLPTIEELRTVAGPARGGAYLATGQSLLAWTVSAWDANNVYVRNVATGAHGFASPGVGRAHALCVRRRPLSTGRALGVACAAGSQCESGFCADGVCCNSACGGGADPCLACSVAAGAAVNGTCVPTQGNACGDGNACSSGDSCRWGSCLGTGAVCGCTGAPAC